MPFSERFYPRPKSADRSAPIFRQPTESVVCQPQPAGCFPAMLPTRAVQNSLSIAVIGSGKALQEFVHIRLGKPARIIPAA
jgi:hypothetical protein